MCTCLFGLKISQSCTLCAHTSRTLRHYSRSRSISANTRAETRRTNFPVALISDSLFGCSFRSRTLRVKFAAVKTLARAIFHAITLNDYYRFVFRTSFTLFLCDPRGFLRLPALLSTSDSPQRERSAHHTRSTVSRCGVARRTTLHTSSRRCYCCVTGRPRGSWLVPQPRRETDRVE